MDVPNLVLAIVVSAYWCGVGAMIVRVRRHARRIVGVVPEQRLERYMWLVWMPLVAAWITLPWLALSRTGSTFGLPEFARTDAGLAALRWFAAALAVACLAATARCWAHMGRDWRMAVNTDPAQKLITDGMFARIRHPIYAFSILLMLCTMLIVPTPPMLVVGIVHVGLMFIKAQNEERHLLGIHGDGYARYLAQTGRFLPRLR